MKLALGLAIGFSLGAAAPAMAQVTDTLPRFYALEQQQQDQQQRQAEKIERERQQEQDRNLLPNSGVTAAQAAMRDQTYKRELDRLALEDEQQRAQVARERQLEDAALPNRRIASDSSVVIRDPQRYILPPAPAGQYYARVDGRFVLVDAASQLVVKVLDPQPTDPTSDVPAAQRPLLGTRIGPDFPATPIQPLLRTGGPILSKKASLPDQLIGPDSPYVVSEPAGLKLGDPPAGMYYANLDGRIYLVDGKTRKVTALVRP